MLSERGNLQTVASNERARELEVFELANDQGPCLDCFRTGQSVHVEDLNDYSGRWPLFTAAALAAGYRSVSSLPLRVDQLTTSD